MQRSCYAGDNAIGRILCWMCWWCWIPLSLGPWRTAGDTVRGSLFPVWSLGSSGPYTFGTGVHWQSLLL